MAVNKLSFLNRREHPQISHGLCPSCYSKIMEELKVLKRS